MSNTVSYGGYNFNPAPFLTLSNEPVFISGQLDYVRQTVSLVGQLTGCSLAELKTSKESLVNALSTGFAQLTVGNTGFTYAKPIGINLNESQLTKILPYEITFSAFQNQDFSQFYGIITPVDKWTFSTSSNNRITSASHTVSAGAEKTTADSLNAAKQFVEGRLNGFENLSMFSSGDTYILVDKSESLDRLSNIYSVTENWSLSSSADGYDISGCIVRPSAQIDWNGEGLSVTVNGTIEGGISGSCDTGYFTPNQAKEFAQNSLINFKSDLESNYYSDALRDVKSYNYQINTGSNLINFSFNFNNNSTITGDVNHEYTVSFDASKLDPEVRASINGRVFYDSYKDIFLTNAPEEEVRYQKVEAFYSGVNQYAITQQHFGYFNEAGLIYSTNPLNTRFEDFRVNKVPFQSEIIYDYSYSNKKDLFSGHLHNASVTVSCEHSIPNWLITATTDQSFCAQELYQSLERKTVSVNGIIPTGISANQSVLTVSGWMSQYFTEDGSITQYNLTTGNNRFSMVKSYIIK